MLTRRSTLLTAFCAAAISVAAPTFAHEAARVETEVALTQTGELNVTHVLQLSAAQRLMFKAGIIETNDMTGLKARAQAAIYASERFELNADAERIKLDILSAEVLGGHLYIYQTGALSNIPGTWSARNSILRDLSPRFDNMVNVPTADGIQTLVFSGSDIEALESTK
jgi:hypothetical protein